MNIYTLNPMVRIKNGLCFTEFSLPIASKKAELKEAFFIVIFNDFIHLILGFHQCNLLIINWRAFS